MPAVSEKQRKLMAVVEHAPGRLFKRNKSVLSMSKQQLHEFASKVNKKAKHVIRSSTSK